MRRRFGPRSTPFDKLRASKRPRKLRNAFVAFVISLLHQLSRDESATLVSSHFQNLLPSEIAEAIADWTGGNPLFVAEVVRTLREGGALISQRLPQPPQRRGLLQGVRGPGVCHPNSTPEPS